MKFWDDSLRICPKCGNKVQMEREEKARCEHCRAKVWFFHYRPIPSPPDIPSDRSESLWSRPTTALLLGAISILGLVVLVAIYNHLIVASVCALVAIGFGVFGFLRHAEAQKIEDDLKYLNRMKEYAEIMRGRVDELTSRYRALLKTGNNRIEHYYQVIYTEAEKERKEVEELRAAAQLDREAIGNVEERIYSMAERFVKDHQKWWSRKLRPDPENYQRNKHELIKAFDFVESVGYELPASLRKETLDKLREDFKAKMHEKALKDEQKRIKQQMREEEKLRKEREKAIREAEEQERELQARLDEALREQKDSHSAEVEELRRQLLEAQSQSERTKSMAEQTKQGHVYILSNIGSFGDNIYKVGMTRRLEPDDRVKELGDASVPFPFDVHAMFSCDDAPTLEKNLHHELTFYRVNRVNFRKEYFQVDLEKILETVRKHHGHIDYVAEPEALEYRETVTISPEELVEVENELVEIGADFEDPDD